MNRKTIAVIRTGIAAAVLLIPLLSRAQDNPGERGERQDRPRARMLARDLFDITPEQEAKLGQLRALRLESQKAFREEMAKLRDKRRELARDPMAHKAEIAALIDQEYKLRAEQAKREFRHRTEGNRIFTPEQLERMRTYRGAFSVRAKRSGLARLRAPRSGVASPRIRRFSRIRPRGRAGFGLRIPLRWRRW